MRSFLLTGLRVLKMHKSLAIIKIPKGSRSGKIAIGTARRAIRANQMGNSGVFEAAWGGRKWKNWSNVLEVVFRKCAPHCSEKHFFEKMWCEKWVRSWKSWKRHLEGCIFYADSHHDPSVADFYQLARHWLLFFENHKISPALILGRPGGMRGGAGRRFEEG